MIPQTIAAVSATAGTPTPIYSGTPVAAVSFSILNGVATIVMASLPNIGYNKSQQVTLWGFTTATYFNGLTVTSVANNPAALSFSFATTHANVTSTADAGNTAPDPAQKFRGVRIEPDKGNAASYIYVGDGNVSVTRYTTQLLWVSGAQNNIWFGGPENAAQNVDASRIFIDTSSTGSKAQVTLFS
jgi:hypothetical protein